MTPPYFLKGPSEHLPEGTSLSEFQGARIFILGGGNTAIDVARNVLRLGGKPVIIHREEERFSRARPDEIAEAKSEGVEFRFATNVARLEGVDGRVQRAVLVRTRQKSADTIPVDVKGNEQTLEVNIVIVATGYRLDPRFSSFFGKLPLRQPSSDSLLPDRRWQGSGILARNNVAGRLAWEREYGLRSSGLPQRDRLWLVGDALMGQATVVGAMAQGRLAACAILERQPRRQAKDGRGEGDLLAF